MLSIEGDNGVVFHGFKNTGGSTSNKLSRNMQLLLTSKVDSLEPDAQLLIRVASIIGNLPRRPPPCHIHLFIKIK